MSKYKFAFVLTCLLSLLMVLAACGGDTGNSGGDSKNTVHMNNSDFVTKTITIQKGESVTLTSDTSTPHIISNGSWENSDAKPGAESGAPTVNSQTISGNKSGNIGPFNTTGTFKFYCTIHPGMNLTVIVQ